MFKYLRCCCSIQICWLLDLVLRYLHIGVLSWQHVLEGWREKDAKGISEQEVRQLVMGFECEVVKIGICFKFIHTEIGIYI